MPGSANSEVTSTATTWLVPNQVEQLRDVAHADRFFDELGLRSKALVAVMFDCGLRVNETVSVDVKMLRMDAEEPSVYLPLGSRNIPHKVNLCLQLR